jgi:hypothetical protein
MTEQPNLDLTHVSAIESTIAEAKETSESSAVDTLDNNVSDTGAADTSVTDTNVIDTSFPNWRDALPDGLKNAPSLAKFKDVESLAKSYLEGEKTFSSRVAIPKEDAPEAEWDVFYKKLGRPDDKRYRPDHLTVGEDEEATLARYEDILHASGLTRKQGEKMLTHMADLSAQMEAEARTREETARAENLAVLGKTFGDQMDVKINHIKAALGQFGGGKEVAALVEHTNYHPALVQFLSSVGEKLASDHLVTGDSPPLSTARQAALDEIKRLEADEGFQVNYRGNDVEKRREAIKRMNKLHEVVCRGSTPDQQTSDI